MVLTLNMKKITSTVRYSVPNWNFCNIDKFDFDGEPSNKLCRFCVKDRNGHHCLLHDECLSVKNGLVSKASACCKASAGFQSTVNQEPNVPTITPKEIIKHAIDVYTKTVDDLLNQGYPKTLADRTAKKYLMGDK